MLNNQQVETQNAMQKCCDLANRARALQADIASFMAAVAGRPYATLIPLQTTYVPTSTGGEGGPDAAPNVAHPISGMNISSNNFFLVYAIVDEMNKFFTNQAVATSDRLARLNATLQY